MCNDDTEAVRMKGNDGKESCASNVQGFMMILDQIRVNKLYCTV